MRTLEIPQNNRPGAGFFVPFFHLVAASICKAFGRLAVAPLDDLPEGAVGAD